MKDKRKPNVDTSPTVYQKGKLKAPLTIRERADLTARQQEFIKLVTSKDVKVVFVSGPAGTSKTFCAVLATLKLLSDKRLSDVVYIRSAVESADQKIGFLPGEINSKIHPYIQPLLDKLEELIPKNEVEMLTKEQRIVGMPISFLRGLNFAAKGLILDEAQNCTYNEIFTFITRTGEYSKVFIIADPDQVDIGNKSGFAKIAAQFDDEESRQNGIFSFRFTTEDIVRSQLVKFIINKLGKKKSE
ncbi:MAG: hypothetical protein D0530_04995 [Methylococcales bacterium]|nr:MAG: hypothetical protein D0530_04995 [Methylococcales bacterium]